MSESSKISKMLEDTISEALKKAVQNLSIEIDEEELLKMLRDSKKQYQRGYKDREHEIVRCKDCKKHGDIGCPLWTDAVEWETDDNWYCADGESKSGEGETIDIREDVSGLWCDDITFCPETCGLRECPRNKVNIRDRTVPHSFSVGIPNDCPK